MNISRLSAGLALRWAFPGARQRGCTLAMLGLSEGSRAAEGRSLVVQDGPLQIPAGTPGSTAGKCISPVC